MEPELDSGVIVYHKGNEQKYVIETVVMDKTRDEPMVLYRASAGGTLYVRTVDNFKERFYMEDWK